MRSNFGTWPLHPELLHETGSLGALAEVVRTFWCHDCHDSQHLKSCKKCQIKCCKWNPTFCRRVASPPGGRNGTKISLKKYEHIIEESWRSILQNIDFWNFGCAGEKPTAVSEAWSGQRPQRSWNLGIVPGLGRTLEVWGFGRWWGGA